MAVSSCKHGFQFLSEVWKKKDIYFSIYNNPAFYHHWSKPGIKKKKKDVINNRILSSDLRWLSILFYTNIVSRQVLWKDINKVLQFFYSSRSSILVCAQQKQHMLLHFHKANMPWTSVVVRISELLFTTKNGLGEGASKFLSIY